MFIQSIMPDFIINSILFKLFFAGFLGTIIGLERDIHGRAAGLRTNMLVSLGAAVFMVLSESIALYYSTEIPDSLLRADPSRIAAQIITGIGFLGAGTIIKYGLSVRGLTTAACLWISAAIGMSIGAGYYDIGIATTLLSLFSLVILNKFDRFYSKDAYRILEIKTSTQIDLSKLINVIKRNYIKILYLDKEKNYEDDTMNLVFNLRLHHKEITDKLSHEIISDLEKSGIKIYKLKWKHQ